MKRRSLPALLVSLVTAALALHVVTAPGAAAAPDPELISEAINDGGMYVDSGARLFADDASKDRLRAQLETAKKPVYVAVLPAGSSLSPAQLYGIVGRKGTFAVLTGNSLKATSNVLPSAQLRSALTGALRSNGADPAGALVSFVHLTNGTPKTNRVTATRQPRASALPTAEPAAEETAPADNQAQAAEPQKKDGGSSLPLIGGVAAAIIVVAGGGFLWWRRRGRSGDATG
jgi:hypothetical protein